MTRQRTRLLAGVAVVAVLPVTVLALAGGGEDGDDVSADRARPTTSTATTTASSTTTLAREDLPEEAQELLDLVDAGRAGTFHARYTVLSPSLGESASSAELEVWRDVDRIRQDTAILDASGAVRTSAFGSATGTVGCEQDAAGAWSCHRVAADPYDPSEDFLRGILGTLDATPVSVADATVGSYAGRCFRLPEAELCLSADGVPLRVDAGGTTYEVVALDASVTDADFEPPAPVVGP